MSNRIKTYERTNTDGEDGSTVLELRDGQIRNATRFGLQVLAGQVRVFGSLDGETYGASPLVLSLEPAVDESDVVTEPQGTFVAETDGSRLHWFFGVYSGLRFVQKGATAAQIIVMSSEV